MLLLLSIIRVLVVHRVAVRVVVVARVVVVMMRVVVAPHHPAVVGERGEVFA
jgi:hypothetical protein